jgi:hypothetical protein
MSAARSVILALTVCVALLTAADAAAVGGDYQLYGGTARQRAEVRAALSISSFNWSVVPQTVAIHIGAEEESRAVAGHIWLDSHLLDAGPWAWGVVQHEYAHQVDFLLLDAADRSRLGRLLDADAWCWETPGLAHGDYGCERFASTLAWSYWPSSENCMKPESPTDESAAMPPARFRALMRELINKKLPRRMTFGTAWLNRSMDPLAGLRQGRSSPGS